MPLKTSFTILDMAMLLFRRIDDTFFIFYHYLKDVNYCNNILIEKS